MVWHHPETTIRQLPLDRHLTRRVRLVPVDGISERDA
jgi:hypothetical protein